MHYICNTISKRDIKNNANTSLAHPDNYREVRAEKPNSSLAQLVRAHDC